MRRVRLFTLRLGPDTIPVHLGWLFTLWQRKYYVDEIYGFLFVQGTHLVSRISAWFDRTIVDGVVNGAAWLARVASSVFAWIDLNIVDGLVNLIGWLGRGFSVVKGWVDLNIVDGVVNAVAIVTGWFGDRLRRLQTGRVQDYMLWVLLGLLAIAGVFLYMWQ